MGASLTDRIEALTELSGSQSDSALAVITTIAEREHESSEVSRAAGYALARVHIRRGSLYDFWWGDFSDAAHHGFDQSVADYQREQLDG
jgi:hypothetical protein